jgi:hypothetical protein
MNVNNKNHFGNNKKKKKKVPESDSAGSIVNKYEKSSSVLDTLNNAFSILTI